MRNFDPATSFGKRVAARYDEHPRGDEAETIEFLYQQARGGPVLELAIGTGRIGLPLAQRGLEVHGIELSDAMVEQLRKKPGGDGIPVTMGDYADVGVEGNYRLIFVGVNTFYALLLANAGRELLYHVRTSRGEARSRILSSPAAPRSLSPRCGLSAGPLLCPTTRA